MEKLPVDTYYVNNGRIGEKLEDKDYAQAVTSVEGVYLVTAFGGRTDGPSFLWLWILLIILLIAAIIAVLYLIIRKKGLGPNLFTIIIVGIVTGFFMVCFGVYMLFSGKVFRKKQ